MALSSSLVSLGVLVGIFGLLALGLNVKFGYTGLLDIGHVAFFLMGAYLTALLVSPPASTQQFGNYILGLNWPWLPAVAVGVLGAGLLGLLVALPAIRLREDYLAITVLGISVILRRIVQSEGWLANGPDSLRGYPLPLKEFFPLPAEGLASALLLGLVVGVFWTAMAYALALQLGDRDGLPGSIAHGAFALTSLGLGYVGSRFARREDEVPDPTPAAAAGLGAGVIAAAGSVAGLGELVAPVFLGAASLFTWAFAALLVLDHFADVPARDALIGLGLAAAFVVSFLPVIMLSGGIALLGTVVLVVAFVYGIYYLGTNWPDDEESTTFVTLIGIAAIWLFLLRYFVFSLVSPLSNSGVGAAIYELVQNVFWLLKFAPAGTEFDYARFLLALTFGTVAACYYLLEVTVKSPFGRVLKAIREDEDVATALGKNTFTFKVQSMILGSAIAGLAGALYAIQIPALTHTLFAPRVTFIAFLIVVIGGVADNRGAILGAVIYWGFWRATVDLAAFFPTESRSAVQALRLAVFGALFIVILYYRPGGILGEEGSQTGGGS
jgi:ABC-type branched-subunit amino acid transport system permease subunit